MGKLIIDPQKLAEIRAAINALDQPKLPGDELPPRVAAFWNAPEPWIPPWRPIESVAECEERDEAKPRMLDWVTIGTSVGSAGSRTLAPGTLRWLKKDHSR